MLETFFEVFHSLLVGHTLRSLKFHHWLPLDRATILHTSHQSEILHSLIFRLQLVATFGLGNVLNLLE